MVTLPSERALQRMIWQSMYALKRQYGGRIDVYRLNDVETNLRTGEKTIDKDCFHLRRAVILPVRISRDVVQSISQISANKKFVYGANFDAGKRAFVIDSRDLPEGFQFKNDDWIVYRSRRYDLEAIQELEFSAGWIITGSEVMGRTPEQSFFAKADDLMDVESEASVA
jgi:hypothetical protein